MPDSRPSQTSFRLAFGRKPSQFGIVAWSPDGRWLAAASKGVAGDGLIWLWDAASGEAVRLEGHTDAIRDIAWSPDGRTLASGSNDCTPPTSGLPCGSRWRSFSIVLHGDVHHDREDALHYLDDARRIHVVGSGTFAAAAIDRPESSPRSYTILRVHRDFKKVEVERRYQRTAEAPYESGPRHELTFGSRATQAI